MHPTDTRLDQVIASREAVKLRSSIVVTNSGSCIVLSTESNIPRGIANASVLGAKGATPIVYGAIGECSLSPFLDRLNVPVIDRDSILAFGLAQV